MIKIDHITYTYNGQPVLRDWTLNVPSGVCWGVWGNNASGKTTLMRVLATCQYPQSGRVVADELDIFAQPLKYRRAMGYLPESFYVPNDMRVADYLQWVAKVKGENRRKLRHRVEEAMDNCNLTALAKQYAKGLSYGERKRLALAQAVLLRPRYVLLDDVFMGLDEGSRECVQRVIKALPNYTTVLITSSELGALQKVCAEVVRLDTAETLKPEHDK